MALRLTALSDQPEAGADLLEGEQRPIQLLMRMRGADDGPHPSPAPGDGGEADALGEDTALEQQVGKLHRHRGLAAHHRGDRRLALADVEAELAKPALEV